MHAFNGVTAIVLAGGRSSRMGTDKSLLNVNGKPLIQHIVDQLDGCFDEVIISANANQNFDFLGKRVVADIEEGRGPLMAIYSCLHASKSEWNFITACDVPTVNLQFVEYILTLSKENDIVIPISGQNKFEPLFAVYNKRVLPIMEGLLKEGNSRIIGLLDYVKAKYVNIEGEEWFLNLNYKDDFEQFISSVT